MKKYFYSLVYRYLSQFILPEDTVLEIEPSSDHLIRKFAKGTALIQKNSFHGITAIDDYNAIDDLSPDYILLNGTLHFQRDIQSYISRIKQHCKDSTRVIVIFYSSLWRPILTLATRLGFRTMSPDPNWLSHEDMQNFLLLSDFERVKTESRVLIPVWIPIISYLVNKYLAPLPFFRLFNLLNILVARPVTHENVTTTDKPSVSTVVPARNESGNIEEIVRRIPRMGPDDELIFVEGHSQDDTWETIQRIKTEYSDLNIVITRQDGIGKGDAVRKGFDLATKDIFMILDADITVQPEDLPRFYDAIVSGKGEFINGSRLVYPMEKRAMRFINLLGNKFFATSFSYVIGQRFKDTLCGTKVLSRDNYLKIARHRSFFGEFDPFGDFDLIFGASRLCLKIVEIPVVYRERTYGSTNISRWKHGFLLVKMLYFAARKLKFI